LINPFFIPFPLLVSPRLLVVLVVRQLGVSLIFPFYIIVLKFSAKTVLFSKRQTCRIACFDDHYSLCCNKTLTLSNANCQETELQIFDIWMIDQQLAMPIGTVVIFVFFFYLKKLFLGKWNKSKLLNLKQKEYKLLTILPKAHFQSAF